MGVVSDERLARRAAQGDRRAFEAIYKRYHQRLYRFCLAMVGNQQDAQDALQNTMVKVLKALPGERRAIELRPWLYRIARNEAIEVVRRRRESSELDPELRAAGGVTETAEARGRLRDLLADLEELPGRQRAVLVMRELSGLGFAEIGEALDTSAAVARQTLYEARLSLRQLEEGREMRCADVTRELSDADGRVIRRRQIRSHLRSCPDCRAFGEAIGTRRNELAAIAPLPLVASAGLLHGLLSAQAGANAASATAGGGGLAGALGAGAGKAVATSTIAKSAATVAVATVVGASAADLGGLVDVPVPGGSASDGGGSGVGPPRTSGLPRGANGAVDGARPPAANGSPAAIGAARSARGRADATAKGHGGAGKPSSAANAPPAGKSVPPRSAAGTSPPGGGYGSAAAEQRRGRPESLPEAAGHGQGTATARRPANTGAVSRKPSKGSRKSSGHSKGSAGRNSSRTPAARPVPPQAKIMPAPKPAPPTPPHPLAPPVERSAPPPHGGRGYSQPVEP